MLTTILAHRPRSSTLLIGRSHATLQHQARAGACFLHGDDRPARLRHPDYLELDASTKLEPDTVRAWLENAHRAPFEGRRTVMCLLAADRVEHSSASALLKTVEEPPLKVTLLLTATNTSRIIPTILSRVFRVHVPDKYPEPTVDQLRSGQKLLHSLKSSDPKDLAALAQLDNLHESIQDAMSLAPDLATLTTLVHAYKLLQAHVNPPQVALSLHRPQ